MISSRPHILTIAVILSGLVTGFLFPPVSSTYTVILLMIPLVHALYTDPERTVRFNFVFGLAMTVSSCYWIFYNSGADAMWIKIVSGFGLFIVNASYYALFGLMYRSSHRLFGEKAVWTLPLLWWTMETAMLFEELAFPWTYLAHTLTGKTEFIQTAEFFGVSSVSAVILYISALIYMSGRYFIKKQLFKSLVYFQAAAFIFFGLIVFGYIRIGMISDRLSKTGSIRASLVHPGLDVEYKWEKKNFSEIISRQMKLSEASLSDEPDLIIWGESNFPRYLENNPSYIGDFFVFAADKKTDLCIGSLGYDYFPETESFRKYNSVFFFDQNNRSSRYDKRKLVPFGESFPFAWALPFLKDISLGQANFDKGIIKEPFPMTTGNRFHANICYEALFPYYNAALVRKGSEFIVNVSNDAWYENSKEIYQHSRFNVFRAIENRRSVVRLANKAENSLFMPTGEQVILFDNEKNMRKTVTVPLSGGLTFFTKYGRFFAMLLLLFGAAVLISGFFVKQKHSGKI